MLQCPGNLLRGEGPEYPELQKPRLDSPLPEYVDCVLNRAAHGADGYHRVLCVLQPVFLEKAVMLSGDGLKLLRHVQDNLFRALHSLRLGLLCLHAVIGNRIGSYRHGLVLLQKIMLRLVLPDEFFDGLIVPQGNVFHGMAGDKAVLADHHRKMHVPVLRNAVGLEEIVIGLLVVLRVNLNPAGIPRSHTVGMLRVDIQGSRQPPVYHRHHNGQAA